MSIILSLDHQVARQPHSNTEVSWQEFGVWSSQKRSTLVKIQTSQSFVDQFRIAILGRLVGSVVLDPHRSFSANTVISLTMYMSEDGSGVSQRSQRVMVCAGMEYDEQLIGLVALEVPRVDTVLKTEYCYVDNVWCNVGSRTSVIL